MEDLIKVENEKGLVRDSRSNAILNTDLESLTRHRAQRRTLEQKEQIIESLTERLEKLESFVKKLSKETK